MKNFIKKGHTLNYVNNGDDTIASGSVVIIGKLAGVAEADILPDEIGSVLIEGVFILSKATGFAIAQGDQLYYNAVTGITKTVTDTVIGVAFEAALTAETIVTVKLLAGGEAAPVSTLVANIKPTTPLTAIAGVYADLAAARTSVNSLATETQTRLAAIETDLDAIKAALKTAGLMASA
jgi:predicted RecA/RadA family phage recombinase